MREWLLFFHVAGAMVFVGGAILVNALGLRAMRGGDPLAFVATFKGSGSAIAPASVVTLLAGIGLVLESAVWTFTSPFVVIGIVMIVGSGAVDSLYSSRRIAAIERIVADRGPDDPEIRVVLGRLLRAASVLALLLLATAWAMVFKPGT